MEAGQSGVYMIVHRDSGKTYIGSTKDFVARRRQHWKKLVSGKHGNKHLQNAVAKYGIGSFDFLVVERVGGDTLTLLAREQAYLDACSHRKDLHYNLCWTACGNIDYTNPATSEKLSQSMKRAWSTSETQERNRLASERRWSDPEEHQRLSDTVKVLMNDPERRARQSEAMIRAWEDPQTRERLSSGRRRRGRGAERTAEEKSRVSEGSRNAWKDPLTRERHSHAMKQTWAKRKASALENRSEADTD